MFFYTSICKDAEYHKYYNEPEYKIQQALNAEWGQRTSEEAPRSHNVTEPRLQTSATIPEADGRTRLKGWGSSGFQNDDLTLQNRSKH